MTVSRYGVVPDPGLPLGVAACAVPGAAIFSSLAPAPPSTAMDRTWRRDCSLAGWVLVGSGRAEGLDADIGTSGTGVRRRSAGGGGSDDRVVAVVRGSPEPVIPTRRDLVDNRGQRPGKGP